MTAVSARLTRPFRWCALAGSIAVLGATSSACSVENSQPMPACSTGGTANIGAQSVPTAALVPCLDPLPAGWEADYVRIDQDGMVVRFDSDRAGDDAAIFHYTATCDIGNAVSSPSEQEGADRFEEVERIEPGFRARRYYVFDGGCIWWEFDFDPGATAALAIDLGDRLQTITRDDLNDIVRESFIDVEL